MLDGDGDGDGGTAGSCGDGEDSRARMRRAATVRGSSARWAGWMSVRDAGN
jgi:hypothetical protein